MSENAKPRRARAYNDEVRVFLEDVLAWLEVTDDAR